MGPHASKKINTVLNTLIKDTIIGIIEKSASKTFNIKIYNYSYISGVWPHVPRCQAMVGLKLLFQNDLLMDMFRVAIIPDNLSSAF